MKKIVMGLLVLCTMLFMTNASIACDFGCDKATISESVECNKDCDCGCQNGEECKCNKSCDKEKCEKKKECYKKCPCGCKNGEGCKCKKECDKAKCDKEKSLLDEIKDSTAAEEISQYPKSKCCKKSKKCCKKFKKCGKKSKCAKKCKKLKQKCKKGCPLEDIIETEEK